ncbi:MAG TPA: hypothetical protein VH436_07570 [Vicinamibacterales bacterium]|jgi:SSS family solute:Na+ symporter
MVALDWLMIALYFAMLAGLTWWSVSRNRNTADDYFLAGRDLGWIVVAASIFATNIRSQHLVGLAGAGATSGVAGYEHGYAPGSALWIFNNVYFQYYSLVIFLVSVAVPIAVAYVYFSG